MRARKTEENERMIQFTQIKMALSNFETFFFLTLMYQ